MNAHEHSQLPLRDYDHLPVPALGRRIRSLTADQVGELLDYERAHAHRLAATQVMEARLAQLESGAEPSGGRQQTGPDWPPPAADKSPAGPRTTAETPSPPPHGVPAQPARPKGDRQAP
ncbi:MAG TPA: hypothetical protein VG164_03950 [Trebonia sp.]|jgi:hypothetical protein|nr:hypothetical protein [Trebonia sp.]